MQRFEATFEEGALQPRSQGRLVLKQEGGRKVAVTLAALFSADAIPCRLPRGELCFRLASPVCWRCLNHPGTDRGVGEGIDQDKTTSVPIGGIRIEEKWSVRFKFNGGDIVYVELRGLFPFESGDVHAVGNSQRPDFGLLGGMLNQKGLAHFHRTSVQPNDHGLKVLRNPW